MCPHDFDSLHHRAALVFPDVVFDRVGGSRACMGSHKADGGAGTLHHDASRSAGCKRGGTYRIEVNGNGLGNAVLALGQVDVAQLRVDGALDGLAIICNAVADRAKVANALRCRC